MNTIMVADLIETACMRYREIAPHGPAVALVNATVSVDSWIDGLLDGDFDVVLEMGFACKVERAQAYRQFFEAVRRVRDGPTSVALADSAGNTSARRC